MKEKLAFLNKVNERLEKVQFLTGNALKIIACESPEKFV